MQLEDVNNFNHDQGHSKEPLLVVGVVLKAGVVVDDLHTVRPRSLGCLGLCSGNCLLNLRVALDGAQ